MSATPAVLPPLEKAEFDTREFITTFCEVLGILLILVITHDPARVFDLYVTTTHLYVLVQQPFTGHVRVIGAVVQSRVQHFRVKC